jgi:hypothetical protein
MSLKKKITERIKPYGEDAERVTRLIGNGYLLSELNAIWKFELRQYNEINGISAACFARSAQNHAYFTAVNPSPLH